MMDSPRAPDTVVPVERLGPGPGTKLAHEVPPDILRGATVPPGDVRVLSASVPDSAAGSSRTALGILAFTPMTRLLVPIRLPESEERDLPVVHREEPGAVDLRAERPNESSRNHRHATLLALLLVDEHAWPRQYQPRVGR